MKKVIGIDLGTTNSVVSVTEAGSPVIIPSAEGAHTIPSVVAFNKNEERLVGQVAKRQAITNPQNTIYSVKRLMGRRIDDPETKRTMEMVSYKVVAGPNEDARINVPIINKAYSPQEISAMILTKLKSDAEAYLGETVTEAVITVPAYFNDSQRQATKDAGKIAGLDVKRIINEPTAAALAYGLDKSEDQTILVFDLGGGTFDVSVLDVGDGVVEVRSTSGDTHLGGDDWDERIVGWMVEEFKNERGIDLSQDPQALQRLREAAEKAKIELSSMIETEINLPFVTADATGPKHLLMKLTQAKFEQLTADLVDRTRQPFEQALKDADLKVENLDEVIFVGGSTRMPMIRELVKSLTGKPPNQSVNPDEVVAAGAAIQGGVLKGEVEDVLLLDVTPLSLGLETMGGVMTVLISRNTTIPTRKNEIFSTAEDNQAGVDIHVLQGERKMANDNKTLGNFKLEGIPAAPRGVPQIDVTFDLDSNGILSVTAKDKATGKEQQIQITASTNLSDGEVDRMVNEATQNEAEDQKRRDLADMRNQSDQLIYSVEKTLRDLGDQVQPTDRSQVENLVSDLRTAMNADDADRMRILIEQLQQATYAFTQQLNQAQAQGQTPSQSDQPEDDVVDGNFSET